MRRDAGIVSLVAMFIGSCVTSGVEFSWRPTTSNLAEAVDSGTWMGRSIEEKSTALCKSVVLLPAAESQQHMLEIGKIWIMENAEDFVDNDYNNGDYTAWLNATSYWAYTYINYCRREWNPSSLNGPYYQEGRSNSRPPMLAVTDLLSRAFAPSNYFTHTPIRVWMSPEYGWAPSTTLLTKLIWTTSEGMWSYECKYADRLVASGRTACWNGGYLPPDELGAFEMPDDFIHEVNNATFGTINTEVGWVGSHACGWYIRIYHDYYNSACTPPEGYQYDWFITANWSWYPSSYAAAVAPTNTAMIPTLDVYYPTVTYETNYYIAKFPDVCWPDPYMATPLDWKTYVRSSSLTPSIVRTNGSSAYLTQQAIDWNASDALLQVVGGLGCREDVDGNWYSDVWYANPKPTVISVLKWDVSGGFKYLVPQ